MGDGAQEPIPIALKRARKQKMTVRRDRERDWDGDMGRRQKLYREKLVSINLSLRGE